MPRPFRIKSANITVSFRVVESAAPRGEVIRSVTALSGMQGLHVTREEPGAAWPRKRELFAKLVSPLPCSRRRLRVRRQTFRYRSWRSAETCNLFGFGAVPADWASLQCDRSAFVRTRLELARWTVGFNRRRPRWIGTAWKEIGSRSKAR